MTTVERKFDDLNPAFVELYSRCGNSSQWFLDVRSKRQHVSPILRVSPGRFDCLHTLPVQEFLKQERFFEGIGLKTTRNISIGDDDHMVGFSRDDLGSLVAEGYILTPERAAKITRKFLLEVRGTHENEIEVHLVYEGKKDNDYSLNNVISSQLVQRTYFLILLVTITLWLPLLALIAGGFVTSSFDPVNLFIAANSLVGYVGFVIAFAMGAGASMGTLHRQLPDAAAKQLDCTLFGTVANIGKNNILIGIIVGIIGGIILTVYNISIVLPFMFVVVGFMGLPRPTSHFEPYFETYLIQCNKACNKYNAAKYRHKTIMEASPPEITVNVNVEACNMEEVTEPESALECLDRVHSELTQVGKTIEQYHTAMEEYKFLKELQKDLKRRAEPFPAVDVDVLIKTYQVESDKAGDYFDYLDSVQEELANIEETIDTWDHLKEEYKLLYEYQNALQERAESFTGIDIDVTIISYSDAKNVSDYRTHLESARDEFKYYENKIDRCERHREAQSQSRDLSNRIQQRNKEFPETSFVPLQTAIDAIAEDAETIEELENKLNDAEEILQHAPKVLDFLDTVDQNHPSVDGPLWRDSVEVALKECYPNILRPIASDVAAMEEGLWERENFSMYTWKEFEELIGSYYRGKDYHVEVTQDSRDGGVDVWATNNDEIIAVQVKHYNTGNVGRPALQKLVSFLAKGDADRVVLVTSADFSESAIKYANEFGEGLDLMDGEDLVDRLSRSNIPPPVQT